MHRFSDINKMDIGLVPQTLNNNNVTGPYFSLAGWRDYVAALLVGAMATATTSKIELLQAQDASGTGAKGIPSTAGQIATATITANTQVTIATLALATVVAGNVVTINGTTFTGVSSGATGNQFNIGGGDAATATNLAAVISAAGIGLSATSATTTVTIQATIPGEVFVTITGASGTFTAATTQALAFVDLDSSQLDIAGGFGYVAAKVTTTANTVVGVGLIRSRARFEPINQFQKVGAGAIV